MKRPRADSDEEDGEKSENVKTELRAIKELLTKVAENNEHLNKRPKQNKIVEDENDYEEQGSTGILSAIRSLFEKTPQTTESIITDLWGHKILNGEVVTTRIPYADAGTLIEYTFFVSYPNFIDDNHFTTLCSNIPHFYRAWSDTKDCKPGSIRFVIQKCESPRLKRLLNREQLKETPGPNRQSIINTDETNIKDESLREMGQRLGKILSISEYQSPDLPTASERTIKGSVIGVTHRNINPPITNTDITQIMGIPLVHSLRIQPEKSRAAIRLTLEIQKG